MSQKWRIKTKRARGSLGGKLRARQGSWLDLGVPGIWQTQQILEPGVRQKPGNSGFMRWRLNGVGRESQEQGSRNQQQGCLETKTAASAKEPRYASCQGRMQYLEWCTQACRWEQGEEANMAQLPRWTYIQGRVLAFTLSLRRRLPSPFSRLYMAWKDESFMYCDNLLGIFRTVINFKHSIS